MIPGAHTSPGTGSGVIVKTFIVGKVAKWIRHLRCMEHMIAIKLMRLDGYCQAVIDAAQKDNEQFRVNNKQLKANW